MKILCLINNAVAAAVCCSKSLCDITGSYLRIVNRYNMNGYNPVLIFPHTLFSCNHTNLTRIYLT